MTSFLASILRNSSKRIAFLAILLGLFFASKAQGVTLTSASLAFSADDRADIWINGTYIGYPSCGSGNATCYDSVHSLTISPSVFNACNVIAAAAYDYAGGQGFFAYDITFTWSDATVTHQVSDGTNALEYFMGSNGGAIPPQGSVSYPSGAWTTYAYVPSSSWFPPVTIIPSTCDSGAVTPNGVTAWTDCALTKFDSFAYRQLFTLSKLGTCNLPTPTPTITPSCGGGSVINLFASTALSGNWTTSTGLDSCSDSLIAREKGNQTEYWHVTNSGLSGYTINKVTLYAVWWGATTNSGPPVNLNYGYGTTDTTTMVGTGTWSNSAENSQLLSSAVLAGPWTWAQIDGLSLKLNAGSTASVNAWVSCAWFEVCYTNNSPTYTSTPTATRTYTITNTFTPTATLTATPTQTSTFTSSYTASPTPSWTPTSTPTPTYTATSTFSSTPTPTPTYTATPTFSDSPTPTSTPTATPTATPTNTFTPTPTCSDSPTGTPTATPTFSFTPTKTFTDSPTSSSTPTPTATFSGTPTFSDSPTPSFSSTPTTTFTGTKTFTFTPTPSPSFTESFSFTGTKTFTDSPTPSPSQTESFSYTGTKTFTDSATETPSFTESATNTETKTQSPTRSETPTKSVTFTFSASPTYSPSPTISPTFSPAAPFLASIKVYNSAGELVAVIDSALPLYSQLSGVQAIQSSFDPDLGGKASLRLVGPDLSVAWDGSGNNGQRVQSGNYYMVVQQTDPSGSVSSWTEPLAVIRSDTGVDIQVYNSAGEMVWHRNMPSVGGALRMGLSSNRLVLGTSPFTSLKISYGAGATAFVAWDGTNSSGLQVATGTYLVRMTQKDAGGSQQYFSKSVTVIRIQSEAFDRAIAWPDPVTAADTAVHFRFEGAQPGTAAWGEIYNLAGVRVASLAGDASAGLAWTIPGHMASGLYLARVSAQTPQGLKSSRTVKFALMR